MAYTVEIVGGSTDPPPLYTYAGLSGLTGAIRYIVLLALPAQRADGEARTLQITLPSVRARPGAARAERRVLDPRR